MTTRKGKINWSGIWESAVKNKRIILIVLGLIALLGLIFFTMKSCQDAGDKSYKDKRIEAINGNLKEIANIESQIQQLEGQKIEKKKQIEEDTKDLANTLAVREDQKAETNQALANFNAAVKANTNVDVSADDLIRRLKELNQK